MHVRAPTHSTAAVPSAISTLTTPEYDGLQRVEAEPAARLRPLAVTKRRCSSSSRVKAWMTRIADIVRCTSA